MSYAQYRPPRRLWICPVPGCESNFEERWRLKRHLKLTHRLGERDATITAERSEYWLRLGYVNPRTFFGDEMD
ncbi:MAG: hypothetical protein HQ553_00525 [Chloroflexi bacterium]|nr:hypothetical protein [Chloroflexota bacterium]